MPVLANRTKHLSWLGVPGVNGRDAIRYLSCIRIFSFLSVLDSLLLSFSAFLSCQLILRSTSTHSLRRCFSIPPSLIFASALIRTPLPPPIDCSETSRSSLTPPAHSN